MRIFNSGIYPPSGFRYRDQTGFVHTGDDWKDLEAKVVDYRKRNGIAPGEPYAEIMNQTCAEVPGFCHGDEPFQLMPDHSGADWTKQVTGWLAYIAGRKRGGWWVRVDDATAARRAAICAVCPLQKALVSSCGACVTNINNMRKALFDGHRPLHQNLSGCKYNGEDTQVTVHLMLEPNCDPALPAHCWRHPS